MKIIISPAKKMLEGNHTWGPANKPYFIEESKELLKILNSMDLEQLTKLWSCSHKLADESYKRLKKIDLEGENQVAALFSYDGIQYQNMAPNAFSQAQLDFITENLRILSGFYGVLRPMDGVMPYRLEMQAKLAIGSSKNLYEFWGKKLAKRLLEEDLTDSLDNHPVIVNLASKEYSKAILPYLDQVCEETDYTIEQCNVITCIFGTLKDGKVVQKSTESKAARGTMVRYLASVCGSTNFKDVMDNVKKFDQLGFTFDEGRSLKTSLTGKKAGAIEVIEETLVFVK